MIVAFLGYLHICFNGQNIVLNTVIDLPSYMSFTLARNSAIRMKGLNRLKVLTQTNLRAFTIMKTHLYSFDSLKPNFHTVKLGFIGVYIILLISAQNIDFGYSLEPPCRSGSSKYLQSMF